jgi:hypothetical protein
MNQCWTIYTSKRFIPSDKILTLFLRTNFSFVLLWILLVSMYPLCKLETCSPLTPAMSQEGASRLQTTANLWTFSINITSPLRIHFLCLILLSYIIIMLPVILYCLELHFSLVLVLALVWLLLCTLSVLACNKSLAVGKHLNKGIELYWIIIDDDVNINHVMLLKTIIVSLALIE